MVPGWVMFKTIEVLSGDPPPPPLEDRVADIRQPLLMVSAGTAEEYEFGVLYDRAGGPNVEHWNLPRAGHTAAVSQDRRALRGARRGLLRPRAALNGEGPAHGRPLAARMSLEGLSRRR